MHSARSNVFRLHETGRLRPPPPGRLTYKLNADELRQMEINVKVEMPEEEIWTLVPADERTKLCLLPVSLPPADWRLVFVMKRETNDTFWLKGAMKNVKTGEVALLSASTPEAIITKHKRSLKSHDSGFHVGWYGMLAPLSFWTMLKATI